jgi:hypothetical protein
MSTLSALQILADVTSAHAASSPYAQTHASNVQPPSWTQPAPFDATSAAPEDSSAQLQTMQPVQPPQPTEESLRAQLDQTDLYDLSGEKAAAEALKREDAFKEQQIQEKAQQTKEFFAEQDRKQQESLQEMQKQADAQLAEKSQKEFWDAKQAQETQASMDKELNGLHEAAQQEHQQWRADFTQGICRDDAAALVNNQIEDRVGAYQDRLTDMGSNGVDAAATVEKYKVKLESESSAEIASRTAELHQEHFPEYQGIAPAKPDGPAPTGPDAPTPPKPDGPLPGEIPSSGFGPFEGGPQGGYGLEGLVNKKGDSGPWEATAGPTPDKPFMRPMMDPRGDGTDAPPGWFKNVDAPPADGKDIPDGFMKPIGPPTRDELAAALKAAGSSAGAELSEFGKFSKETLTNPENIHLMAESVDHAHEWAVIPGIPHDVAAQLGQQYEIMRELGVDGLKASAKLTMDQAKEFGQGIKSGAEEFGEKVMTSAQEFGDKARVSAQELGEKAKASAQEFGEKAKASAQEWGDKAKASVQEFGEKAKASAQEWGEKAKTEAQELGKKAKDGAQELGDKVKTEAQELGAKAKASAQELGAKAKAEAQELGDKAIAGAQVVKDNLKVSSNETLDKKVKEDVKPETEFNKVQKEVHTEDVTKENAALAERMRVRALEMGQTEAKAKAEADRAATHAASVDQKVNPPTPPATITTPGQPTVAATTPATPAAPAAPAAPAQTTPQVSLAKTSPS